MIISINEFVLQDMVNGSKMELAALKENCSSDTIGALDSLTYLSLILALEEEFPISFPDEEVGELVNYKLIEITIHEQFAS